MAKTKERRNNQGNVPSFKKLIDLKEECIGRGAIFRMIGEWPYEDVVDFMLFDTLDQERTLGFITATGYKAGLQCVHLPNECLFENTRMLSTKWIVKNWKKWVYPQCSIEDIYYIQNYPTPSSDVFSKR